MKLSVPLCMKDQGWYSQTVTKLETANFSHPFYGTPICAIYITFELL